MEAIERQVQQLFTLSNELTALRPKDDLDSMIAGSWAIVHRAETLAKDLESLKYGRRQK